jgi:hypothetical protein
MVGELTRRIATALSERDSTAYREGYAQAKTDMTYSAAISNAKDAGFSR